MLPFRTYPIVRTLWMAPKSVFVYASMIHLIATILRILREKGWFGLATNSKKNVLESLF